MEERKEIKEKWEMMDRRREEIRKEKDKREREKEKEREREKKTIKTRNKIK